MRTFIAAEIGSAAKEKIADAVKDLEKKDLPVKWVSKENLHITLKFIGDIDGSLSEKTVLAVKAALKGTGSFDIELGGLGTFPAGRLPRIIWIGIKKGALELAAIAGGIDRELEAQGICGKEEKAFSAHVTIGRVKGPGPGKIEEALKGLKDAGFGMVKIESIDIMKSSLAPDGPVYGLIEKIGLK